VELGRVRQASGKIVTAWAIEGDCDPAALVSNTCAIEWPPRSGKTVEIPEVDRGAWFALPEVRERILAGQSPFLDALERQLSLA
jgi:predicted NUDIX family NTP pyrophosphohydrolase